MINIANVISVIDPIIWGLDNTHTATIVSLQSHFPHQAASVVNVDPRARKELKVLKEKKEPKAPQEKKDFKVPKEKKECLDPRA